jgi:cyanate permease
MRDGWRIVAVGFVLLLLMFGTRLSFGVFIKPMAEDLEATRASISASQSLYMLVHIYPYLTDIGFEGKTAAKALGYLGLISTVTMVAFAPLGDRFNKRLLLTWLFAGHTLLLLWLIHLRGTLGLWGFVFFYGVHLGMAWPLTISILAETFGSRSVSAILGACTLAFGLAGLIAPWLAGYVFDLYKCYHPVFYLTVALSAVCVVFAYWTRKTQKMIESENEAA